MARPKKIYATLPIVVSYVEVPFPSQKGQRGRPRSDSHLGFILDGASSLVQEFGEMAVVGAAMVKLREKLNADYGIPCDCVYQPYKGVYTLKTKAIGKDLVVTVDME